MLDVFLEDLSDVIIGIVFICDNSELLTRSIERAEITISANEFIED